VISLKVGLFLVIGANLGSAIVALVATAGAGKASRRVALGNLLFKLIGCALTVALLPWIEHALTLLDPDPQRLVVNFHTAFNLLLAASLIWFTAPVARLAERLLPEDASRPERIAARHLDPAALESPAIATSNAAREVLRIGDIIESMLEGLLRVIRTNDAALARRLRRMDDDVDGLYTAIKLYLTQIGREALDERDARRWADIISFTINLEHVGDILERMLDDLLEKKIAHRLEFSEAGMAEICDMHARVAANLRLGLNVFLNADLKSAQRLLATKVELRKLQQRYADTHLGRLAGQTVQSIETSSLHLDIINDFKRINSHICSVAYPILEQAGALQPTRLREDFANGEVNQKHA
jgi:phosphate:Na+ symporter